MMISTHMLLYFSHPFWCMVFSPEMLCTSTIIPIPKGCNVNVTVSAKFRGIALSSIFVKIFDHIALQKYHDYFFLHLSCNLVLKQNTLLTCAR